MLGEVKLDQDAWRSDYLELIAGLERRDFESRYHISIDFDENCRFAATDLRDWPGRILILEGGADRVAPPRIRESLRALYPEAVLHAIPDAGHSILLTHTEECVAVVRRFIAEP